MVTVRIIGVGSPFGDDRAAWRAAECLRRWRAASTFAADIEVITADRPGTRLIELWREAHSVILIDAMCSGAAIGSLREWSAADLRSASGLVSTHGIGVAQALDLAGALGALPARLALFAVEIDRHAAGPALSGAVARSIEPLARAVLARARSWCGCDGRPQGARRKLSGGNSA